MNLNLMQVFVGFKIRYSDISADIIIIFISETRNKILTDFPNISYLFMSFN